MLRYIPTIRYITNIDIHRWTEITSVVGSSSYVSNAKRQLVILLSWNKSQKPLKNLAHQTIFLFAPALQKYLLFQTFILGAFRLTKIFGNFVQNLNGKARFGSFRQEYSGPPLEVDHFDRSPRWDRNLPFYFHELVSCLLQFRLHV